MRAGLTVPWPKTMCMPVSVLLPAGALGLEAISIQMVALDEVPALMLFGNIEAGQTIWSGCAIVAGGRIHSTMSVLVGKEDLRNRHGRIVGMRISQRFYDSRISITPIRIHRRS